MITEKIINTQQDKWLNINTDNKNELKQFFDHYAIDNEFVAYSLDRNERAHIDVDQETETFVLIFNVPNKVKSDNHYETIPMTFIIKDRQLITVTNNSNYYIYLEMEKYLTKTTDITLFNLLFDSLFLILDRFFPYIEEMDRERKQMNSKLKEKTTKQRLLLLSDLETGILYFVSASKQNAVLLDKIKTHSIYHTLNESEKERLDDAIIEVQQLVEMTQLSSQILHQLSGTYNNVLNNNINDTMKLLTVLSLLLTIPTIITGFFGMNMPLPLEHNMFGWLITIAISTVLWFTLALILRKLMK